MRNNNLRPRVSSKLVFFQEENGFLVLDPDSPAWVVVNETAFEIIKHCNGKNTIDDIAIVIADLYQQDYEKIRTEIESCIKYLTDNSIIRSKIEITNRPETKKPLLKSAYVEITGSCNLKCIHCLLSKNDCSKELTTEEIFSLIDSLYKNNLKSLSIGGGEPLLREDFMEIIKHASNKMESVTIMTNGCLIDENLGKELNKLSNVYMQVSLDGSYPQVNDAIRGKGAFEAVIAGIDILCSNGMRNRLTLNMTLMRPNVKNLPEMIELSTKLGLKDFSYQFISKLGAASANWSKLRLSIEEKIWALNYLYEQFFLKRDKIKINGYILGDLIHRVMHSGLPNYGCTAGEQVRIDPQGNVFPCTSYIDYKFCIGNIKQVSVEDIINNDKNRNIHGLIYSRINDIEICSCCPWRYYCGAGCMACAYAENGKIMDRDDFCEARQHLYKQAIFDIYSGAL